MKHGLQDVTECFNVVIQFFLRSLFSNGDEQGIFHVLVISAQGEADREAFFGEFFRGFFGGNGQVDDKLVEKPFIIEVGFYLRDLGEFLISIGGLIGAQLGDFFKSLLAYQRKVNQCC